MGWLQIHKTENLTMEPATGDATRDHVLLGSLHLIQTLLTCTELFLDTLILIT